MRSTAVHGVVGTPAAEKPIDESGGKRIAAAHAVEDFKVGHRASLMEAALVVAHSTPVVHGGRPGMAKGRRDDAEVGISRNCLFDHFAEVREVQLTQLLAYAFDLKAQCSGEVLFIADHHVDILRELAIDLSRACLSANCLPQRVS